MVEPWPEEAVREVAILTEALDNATAEVERLRGAVRVYLTGAPLDEHGRFTDPAREALYRAAHNPHTDPRGSTA